MLQLISINSSKHGDMEHVPPFFIPNLHDGIFLNPRTNFKITERKSCASKS